MHESAYRYQAEEAIENRAALERLRGAAEADDELDDAERAGVLAVVDRYLGDHDRAEHDPTEGEPMGEAELEEEGVGR